MIATAVPFYNLVEVLSVIGGVALIAIVIAALVYFDANPDRSFRVWPRFPRVIPFTTAARIQKAKAVIDLEIARRDMFEAKHSSLQQELVYADLKKTRELESGSSDN